MIGACFLLPHHTPDVCSVLPLRAHVHSMSIDRANLGGNLETFSLEIRAKRVSNSHLRSPRNSALLE